MKLKTPVMSVTQFDAFELAGRKARELMSALYRIRNEFYIDNTIPDNGHGVWQYIPQAQSLVHEIESKIALAKASVK